MLDKKILLLIAQQGFQPIEYREPKEILEKSQVEVKTASREKGKAISSNTEEIVKVDLSLDDIRIDDFDGIFLIGGPQALEYLDNNIVYNLMNEAKEKEKLWGAICISPRILAFAGLLEGKKVTGWDGDGELEEILNNAGAEYIREGLAVDGNLITASGPLSAKEFGKAILNKLK